MNENIRIDKQLLGALAQERYFKRSEAGLDRMPYMQNFVRIINGFTLRNFSNPQHSLEWLETALEANEKLYPDDFSDIQESLLAVLSSPEEAD